jgi:hypothetical protein
VQSGGGYPLQGNYTDEDLRVLFEMLPLESINGKEPKQREYAARKLWRVPGANSKYVYYSEIVTGIEDIKKCLEGLKFCMVGADYSDEVADKHRIYNFLFKTKFEDVPLRMNDDLLDLLVRWRLTIGK